MYSSQCQWKDLFLMANLYLGRWPLMYIWIRIPVCSDPILQATALFCTVLASPLSKPTRWTQSLDRTTLIPHTHIWHTIFHRQSKTTLEHWNCSYFNTVALVVARTVASTVTRTVASIVGTKLASTMASTAASMWPQFRYWKWPLVINLKGKRTKPPEERTLITCR